MQKLPFKFTTEEVVKEGRTTFERIETIRRWLDTQDPEAVPPLQDELIVIFLLSCDNNVPLTKNTITMYYKCKRESPDIFDDRQLDRDEIKRALDTVYLSSIPVRTDENYAVHYFKLRNTSYTQFDLVPAMKVSYMLLDVTQEKDLPNGLIVIIDMKGLGLMHLSRLRIRPLKRYLQFLQEGFPIQLKVIHLINAVYFIDKILNLIKPFMKGELIEMLRIHPPTTDPNKLFALVPKKCWPEDYGGDSPSVDELQERTLVQFSAKQEFWRIEQEMRHE